MLGQKDNAEYIIELVKPNLDEDELEDFGMETHSGIEDETGEECWITIPSTS
jgi:hypothetical protein